MLLLNGDEFKLLDKCVSSCRILTDSEILTLYFIAGYILNHDVGFPALPVEKY